MMMMILVAPVSTRSSAKWHTQLKHVTLVAFLYSLAEKTLHSFVAAPLFSTFGWTWNILWILSLPCRLWLNLLLAVTCVAMVLVPLLLRQVSSHCCHLSGLLSVLDLSLSEYNQTGSLWRHSLAFWYWSVAYCLNGTELFISDICCKNSLHHLHHFSGFQLHD
jgi:hypothetical protein